MAQKKKIVKAKTVSKTKAISKPAAKPVKKPVAKVTAKPVAKKAVPAKKAVVKQPIKKVSSTKKVAAPVKAAKIVTKPAAKTVAKAPVKQMATKAPVKTTPVKAPAKAIVVKPPINQNITTPVAKKSPVVMQKTAEGYKPVSSTSSSMMMRPAYRPIQVTNKSLAPIQPTRQMAPAPTPANEKVEYKKGDYVVYPAHGVGQIEAIEMATIAGMEIKLYAIVFEKDRMRLKVPVFKAHASGLRRLSTTNRMQDALKTLQGRAQIRRAMWSRRAQEYETKINSGDPVSIAEVLRDLKRSNDDSEQSYSERQIYQSAMERLAREVAAVDRISEIEATERLEKLIRGGRKSKAEEKAIEDKAALAQAEAA